MLRTGASGGLDRFLTFVLVLLSGHPVVLQYAAEATLICFFFILLVLALIRSVRPRLADMLLIVSFFAVSAFHLFQFQTIILSAVLGFLLKLLIAFLAARTLRDFERTYVEVMYVLAIIGVLTFGLYQSLYLFGIDPHATLTPLSLLDDDRVHIGLHNFNRLEETHRNSGLFWEPGAFAGYLLLGIVFLAATKETYTRYRYRRRLMLFVIALLSTQSTVGYLVAPIALTLHVLPTLRRMPRRLHAPAIFGAIALVSVLSVLIAGQFSFLWPKVEEQLYEVSSQERGWATTRFGGAVYDAEFIAERPLTGWSAHPATREGIDPLISELLKSHGNGLTTFIVRFGLLGLFVYVFATFRSMRLLFGGQSLYATISLFVILVLTNGEQYLDFPLFLAAMFVGSSYGLYPAPGLRLSQLEKRAP